MRAGMHLTWAVATCSMLACVERAAAPTPDAGVVSCPLFDHSHQAWGELLDRYVRGGSVRYAQLAAEASTALEAYLASLSSVCPQTFEGFDRAQRTAFWVNAYNAAVVALVVRHRPARSILEVGGDERGTFHRARLPLHPVLRRTLPLSLDEVEREAIAAGGGRVHFALVCAARSCPPLARSAYVPQRLDRQLEEAARAFLSDPAHVQWDRARRVLRLPILLDWYRRDFEPGQLLEAVAPFLAPGVRQEVERSPVHVEFVPYDWTLNDTALPP